MAKMIPLNGYAKIIGIGIILLSFVIGLAVGATSMKKDIEANTNNIALLRDDIMIIKSDVKELLKR